MIDFEANESPFIRKDERELILKPIEGKAIQSSSGITDNRLFDGTNVVRAVRDFNDLWSIKYEKGSPPPVLKQRFTSFSTLLKFVSKYYEKRGLQIVEVKD